MGGEGRGIDDDLVEMYLHGRCHLLAAALHRLTGLPIHAYVEPDFDDPEGMPTCLVHAFVLEGESGAIDARGRMPLDRVLDEFEHWAPEIIQLDETELAGIGGPISDGDPEFERAMELARMIAGEFDPGTAPGR